MGGRDQRRPDGRDDPDQRDRAADRAEIPRGRRDRDVRGVIHSARWDHDYELAGKRIASIGTGASAIQYVPAIAPEVEKLTVFQRSARGSCRTATARSPSASVGCSVASPPCRAIRSGVYLSRELLVVGLAKEPRLMRIVKRAALGHIEKQIADPALREKLTPSYEIGCNRMVPSNRWYRALAEPNVELAGALAEVRPPRSSTPTAPSMRSTRSSSARASTSPTCLRRSPTGRGGPR